MTAKPKAKAPTRSYETAVERVEEIVRRFDSGDVALRESLDLVREGAELIEYCSAELDAVSGEIDQVRLDELAGRLGGAR